MGWVGRLAQHEGSGGLGGLMGIRLVSGFKGRGEYYDYYYPTCMGALTNQRRGRWGWGTSEDNWAWACSLGSIATEIITAGHMAIHHATVARCVVLRRAFADDQGRQPAYHETKAFIAYLIHGATCAKSGTSIPRSVWFAKG